MSHTETIEIEKKFYVQKKDSVLEKLLTLGWESSSKTLESDTYLTDKDGKFIKNRTCLRSRFKAGKDSFTLDYKPASETNNSFFIKKESNIEFPNESYWGVFELLNNLGYYKYVTVEKKRESFSKIIDNFEAVVTLDEIAGIGFFVELELTIPVENFDPESGKGIFEKVFEEVLSIPELEEVNLPYRDIVAKKFNEIWLSKKKNIYIDLGAYLAGKYALEGSSSKNLKELESLSKDLFEGNCTSVTPEEPTHLPRLSNCYNIILIVPNKTIYAQEGTTSISMDEFIPEDKEEDLYISSSEIFSSKIESKNNIIYLSYKPQVKLQEGALHIDSLQEITLISDFAPKI